MSRHIRDRDWYERGSKWFADWHRGQDDDTAAMIDLDGVGYCHRCVKPLYLVEATESRRRKTAVVTEALGELAGLDVFVFYRDATGHPGELLVDHRTAAMNLGWMPELEAWNVLMSIRREHRFVCAAQQRGSA